MIVFQTDRLTIRQMKESDKNEFHELLTKPEIVHPIPHAPYDDVRVDERFALYTSQGLNYLKEKGSCWAVTERVSEEMIGLALLLTNDEGTRELGYRFRTEYWNKGYGTEVARGLIHFCFTVLNLDQLSADANLDNVASNRILRKFMRWEKEVYEKQFDSLNNRYQLKKKDWQQSKKDV